MLGLGTIGTAIGAGVGLAAIGIGAGIAFAGLGYAERAFQNPEKEIRRRVRE